jgi:hypothetical protein
MLTQVAAISLHFWPMSLGLVLVLLSCLARIDFRHDILVNQWRLLINRQIVIGVSARLRHIFVSLVSSQPRMDPDPESE